MKFSNSLPWVVAGLFMVTTVCFALEARNKKKMVEHYQHRAVKAETVLSMVEWQGERYSGRQKLCPYCISNPHTADCKLNHILQEFGDISRVSN